MMNKLNQVAADMLLKGEESEEAKQRRKAAKLKVGNHLKSAIKKALKEETKLSDEKINIIQDKVVESYLK